MKKQMLRGQVAIEFFVYSALFLFVVLSAYFLVTFVQNAEIPQKQNFIVREVGRSFVDAVTLAVNGKQGFLYEFRFSPTILGEHYNVSIYDSTLVMQASIGSSEFSALYPLPEYEYEFAGCWDRQIMDGRTVHFLNTKECSNIISFENRGNRLILATGARIA